MTAIGMEDGANGTSNMTGTEDTNSDRMAYEESSMWDGIDVVVVAFFVLAAVWLFLSIIYSIILLLLLRLQAQGRLDLDDEDFGRLECCNGFFGMNLGCIARRYAFRMTRNDNHSPQQTITRLERRTALEVILKASQLSEEEVVTDEMDQGETDQSQDDALCSICLSEYEKDDVAIITKCDHRFHRSCLMDWLERKNNSECPVCRQTLVTEELLWERVQLMRNCKRKKHGILQSVARIMNVIDSRLGHSHSGGASSSSTSMTDDDELSDVERPATD